MKDAVLIFAVFLFASALAVWAAGTHQHKDVPELPLPVHLPNVGEWIVQRSLAEGLAPHIAIGVAWSESRVSNPPRPSRTNDWGPMQVHAPTWVQMGLDPMLLLDYRITTAKGVEWLAGYLRRCGSERAAVRAYARGRCQP